MKIKTLLLTLGLLLRLSVNAQSPERLTTETNRLLLNNGVSYQVDQYLYFPSQTGNYHEIWRSDGTVSGSRKVMDLAALFPQIQQWSSMPQGFVSANGKVFISLQINNDTTALMAFTHQELVPRVVKYFRNAGMLGGSTTYKHIRPMVAYNNKCWFGAEDFAPLADLKGVELWCSDGTTQGTQQVAELITQGSFGFNTSSYPSNFLVWNNKLYFSALKWTGSGMNFRFTLYESDGTNAGTKPVNNGIYVFSETGAPYTAGQFNYKILNQQLYISYRIPFNINQEEYAVAKVVGEGLYEGNNFFRFNDFTLVNGKIIVSGIPSSKGILNAVGAELYSYDLSLTNASETLVADINKGGSFSPGPYALTPVGNKLYFIGREEMLGDPQIFETDLTQAGTKKLTNLKVYNFNQSLTEFKLYQNKIYYNVFDSMYGNELYALNTIDNTTQFWDIFPGTTAEVANNGLTQNESTFIEANGVLFFNAIDSAYGPQLWKIGNPTNGLGDLNKFHTKPIVYPNPCTNRVYVEGTTLQSKLIITSMEGKQFILEPNSEGAFDTEQLPDGLYLIHLMNQESLIFTGRLAIQK